jgi:hypothetical protein
MKTSGRVQVRNLTSKDDISSSRAGKQQSGLAAILHDQPDRLEFNPKEGLTDNDLSQKVVTSGNCK